MKLRNIILFCVFVLQLYIFNIWHVCVRFNDFFQFSPFDAHLKTDDAIRNDVGYSPLLVRFFHNKIWVDATEFTNRYFHFWNTNFDLLFFSLVGYFGLFYAFYSLVTRQRKSVVSWMILTVLIFLPCIEVFSNPLPFIVKFSLLTIPYYLFALYGLGRFMLAHKRRGIVIVLVLLVVSLWYFFTFQKDIFSQFCYNK